MKIAFEGKAQEVLDDMRWFLNSWDQPTSPPETMTECYVSPEDAETVPLDEVPLPSPVLDTPNADAVELDADGVRWDETIHASTKTKTKDGKWKKRKGGPKTTESLVTPPPGPPVRDYVKETQAEYSRLMTSGCDIAAVSVEALTHAGFTDQSQVWDPTAPAEKLEALLAFLKSK